jgi:hypothetical protein
MPVLLNQRYLGQDLVCRTNGARPVQANLQEIDVTDAVRQRRRRPGVNARFTNPGKEAAQTKRKRCNTYRSPGTI